MKKRADVLVVEQGLAPTRNKAQSLIMAGQVLDGDTPVEKPGQNLPVEAKLRLRTKESQYVSRGALKLIGALDVFKIDLSGKICLDVGASTGGFTQACLERGANQVFAIDVGQNQLDWKIRSDPKVIVREKINIRHADPSLTNGERMNFICIDVSFISLKIVLPAIIQYLMADTDVIALIKPQHEVGKDEVGKGGVVRDLDQHARVCQEISKFAQKLGLIERGLIESPIKGSTGNKEFLIYLKPI